MVARFFFRLRILWLVIRMVPRHLVFVWHESRHLRSGDTLKLTIKVVVK
jgi:hypothetical protein